MLKSGEEARVRAIRPADSEALHRGFRGLSPASVRARFLSSKKDLSAAELTYFTDVDFEKHVALVATVERGGREEIVGVGRYVVAGDGTAGLRAEFALVVADGFQRQGVGSAILEGLASLAASAGIAEFESIVHRDNEPMLRLFEKCGFVVKQAPDYGLVRAIVSLRRPERGGSR